MVPVSFYMIHVKNLLHKFTTLAKLSYYIYIIYTPNSKKVVF